MSQDNVELIKRGLEAWNRGEWDRALEDFADDAVWTPVFAALTGPRSFFGRDEIKGAWVSAAEVFGGAGTYHADAHEYRDLGGGAILASFRISGRGTSSGIEIDRELVQIWTLRGGRVVRVDTYDDVATALAAVG